MNRKEELSNYLNLLLHLKNTGIVCKAKIKQVLSELHKEMGFEDKPEFEMSVFIEKGAIKGSGNIEGGSVVEGGSTIEGDSPIKVSPFDIFG